jgi:acyl-CoA synthetase (AMP-forming)/AMP-acid ligase II
MTEGNVETLVRCVQRQAAARPHQAGFSFLVDGDAARLDLTYGELDAWARAIAAGLQLQLDVGDRVLLLFPPGLEFLVALFGCLYAAAVAVPVPAQYLRHRHDILTALARDSAPRLALTTRSLRAELTAASRAAPESAAVAVEAVDLGTHDLLPFVQLDSAGEGKRAGGDRGIPMDRSKACATASKPSSCMSPPSRRLG